LLTGLLVCGKCGNYLNGETKRDHPDRPLRRIYTCRVQGNTSRQGGCGGVTRNADALEHFVRETVCYRLDSPDLAALLTSTDQTDSTMRELLTERETTTVRKNALVDDYADGTLSKPDYARAHNRLEKRLLDVDSKIDELRRQAVNVSLNAGETVREAWISRTNGWRRELMSTVLTSIVVLPGLAKPYYNVDGKRMRFAPSLIELTWKV
jgi:site-specific DNA recombinase